MTCEFCGGDAFTSHQALEMMLGMREPFEYCECQACGCLKLNTVPEDMGRYYPADHYYAHVFELDARARVRRLILRIAVSFPGTRGVLDRLFHIQTIQYIQSFQLAPQMRILDVGSGVGRFVRDLRSAGFRTAVGVDPFIASDMSDEFGIVVRKLSFADAEDGWDRIMFHHSFEHVPNQVETLRTVKAKLAPGGLCIVRIPVVNWAWKHYGSHWVQLDAPRHLYLHTEKSFRLAAAEAGLRVVDTRFDSTDFQFWGSELYRQNVPLKDGVGHLTAHFSRNQLQEFRRRSEDLNRKGLGDQAIFFLRGDP
jgi:SAM-dependent methyltransferase